MNNEISERIIQEDIENIKDIENIQNQSNIHTTVQIKIFQLTIVIILLISAFFAGKLSMKDDFYELYNRIDQLEVQIKDIQKDIP